MQEQQDFLEFEITELYENSDQPEKLKLNLINDSEE